MRAPHERLCRAHEQAGKSHGETAAAAGLSLSNYFDLEVCEEEEAFMAVTLIELQRACAFLGITWDSLLAEVPAVDMLRADADFQDFAGILRQHLIENNRSLAQFEDEAGWTIGDFLDHPERAWDWTFDQLRDVCQALGIKTVLPC